MRTISLLLFVTAVATPVVMRADDIEHQNWSTGVTLPPDIKKSIRAKFPSARVINACKGSYSAKGIQELAVLIHDPNADEHGKLSVTLFLGKGHKKQMQIEITRGFAIFQQIENGIGVMSLTSQEVKDRNQVGYADAGGIKLISANDTVCVADAADGTCFQLSSKSDQFEETGGWAN